MSKPKGQDIEASISKLTGAVQKLEQQESQLQTLINSNSTNTNVNKQNYIKINTKKWKLIEELMKLKKTFYLKQILPTMKAASLTIKQAISFMQTVDTPSMQQINLTNPSFDPEQLTQTMINLKQCSNYIKTEAITFINTLSNEWQNNQQLRNSNYTIENKAEQTNFVQGINILMKDLLKSFITMYNNSEQQRISLLSAKCNVLVFKCMSNSDILCKLMLKDGQFTPDDVENEVDKFDDVITKIKQCMKSVVAVSDELQDEVTTISNTTNNGNNDDIQQPKGIQTGEKQRVKVMKKYIADIGAKLCNLHRAMLTIEDIKIDYDITKLLKEKSEIIQRRIDTLGKDATTLKSVAGNYMKIKQKENARNMLKRKLFCTKQQSEYKRKLKVLETAIQSINDVGDAKDNGDVEDDELKTENDNENDRDSSAELDAQGYEMTKEEEDAAMEYMNKLQMQNDEMNNTMLTVQDSDYTKWKMDDIVDWILSLNTEQFLKYEESIRKGMNEKGIIDGSQLALVTKKDLLDMSINESDAVFIYKQIEQLVGNYAEDLLDELYDD